MGRRTIWERIVGSTSSALKIVPELPLLNDSDRPAAL